MSATMSREQIDTVVRGLLVEVLAVRPEQVTPRSRVIPDLGAESIDLLDLRFRVEKAFGLRISSQELATAFGAVATAADFHAIFTVQAMCDYVAARLESDRA